MEHSDLVAEMAHVEHLTTQERLHLARKRRIQQLKVWAAREKDWIRHQRKGRANASKKQKHIFFSDSVMLLEAAARNDIEEGKAAVLYFLLLIAAFSLLSHVFSLNFSSRKTAEERSES